MKATQNSKLRTSETSIFQLKTSLSRLNLGTSFEKKTGFFTKRIGSSQENLKDIASQSQIGEPQTFKFLKKFSRNTAIFEKNLQDENCPLSSERQRTTPCFAKFVKHD
jgi:hypothetical protein